MNQAETPDPNTIAVQKILQNHHSPLPWWTIVAFKADHPDFDVPGYLSVVWCESSLGTTGGSAKYNNPGNIKYVKDSTRIWHTLANGRWYCKGQGWYNTYCDTYTGQRAVILLIYQSSYGYNSMLAADDFEHFARVYYGANVPGIAQYVKCLKAAHALLVKEAATYGAVW